MEINRNISTTQLTWIVGTLVGLVMAVFMGSAVGSADFSLVSIVLGVGIGIATFLVLGKDYWMLIPFSVGASFPALPLGGRFVEFSELAIAGCGLFFLMRVASRKEKLHLFRSVNTPILLFMGWVGMVFLINPVGFAAMGAQTGGGRFYLKLALAFTAFLVLSNRKYTDRDLRWIFGLLIFGACYSLVYGFYEHILIGARVDPNTGLVVDEYYTWHQLLAGPPLTVAFLMFARWKPSEIFSLQRTGLLLIYCLCVMMVLASGKRMAFVAIFLAPFVSAVMHRQASAIVGSVGLAILTMTALIGGQGEYFQLPLTVQRTLSWLPGDWDKSLAYLEQGQDTFRDELRIYAMENIKSDPWVGNGFSVNIAETVSVISAAGSDTFVSLMMANGRSWHNTWLGYAADFGIPLSVIQAVIFVWVLVLSTKIFRFYGNNSFYGVFGLYTLIFTLRDLISSHTGGHTALDAFMRWPSYAILVSIFITMRLEIIKASTEKHVRTNQGASPAHPPHITQARNA